MRERERGERQNDDLLRERETERRVYFTRTAIERWGETEFNCDAVGFAFKEGRYGRRMRW